MRARRREINIFNMSLLDILCGALGAFCFMMLVALPYYKPPGQEKKLREQQEETNQLLREIEKMKEKMGDQQSAEDLAELVRRLEAQIKLLQGEVNRLTAENDELKRQLSQLEAEKKKLATENGQLRAQNQQLQTENQQLQTQNQQLEAEKKQLVAENNQLQTEKKQLEQQNQSLNQALNQRQPFVVLSTTGSAGESARIYLADNRIPEGKTEAANPEFNPEFSQGSGWSGDRVGSFPAEGISFWVSAAVTPESVFKVYVRNDAADFGRRTFSVRTALFGNLANGNAIQMMPGATLTRERYWAFLGTIKIDQEYRPLFTPATEVEQEVEWRRLSKTRARATPTPTLAPSATQAPALSPDVAEAQHEFEAALHEMNEAMSSTGPGSDERKRKAIQRFDEAQKKMLELRQRNRNQQPAPGPEYPFGSAAPPLQPPGAAASPAPATTPP